MADARDFSVILFLVLAAICAYLANTRAIGGGAFAGALLASGVCVLLIRNVDRLEQLVFRRGDDQLLVQLRQIEKNVYAKVEELRKLATGVATFTAASIVGENRIVGEDHQEKMLRRRDELEQFLAEAGVEPARRAEIVRPITVQVDWDMRHKIVGNAVAAWRLPIGTNPNNPPERERFKKDLERRLEQPDRMKGTRRSRGNDSTPLRPIESHLDSIRRELPWNARDRQASQNRGGRCLDEGARPMTFGIAAPQPPREPAHPEQLRVLWHVERRKQFRAQIITAAIYKHGDERDGNLLHSELARWDFTPLEEKAADLRDVLLEKGWTPPHP